MAPDQSPLFIVARTDLDLSPQELAAIGAKASIKMDADACNALDSNQTVRTCGVGDIAKLNAIIAEAVCRRDFVSVCAITDPATGMATSLCAVIGPLSAPGPMLKAAADELVFDVAVL